MKGVLHRHVMVKYHEPDLDDRGRFVLDVAKDDKTEYTSAANVLFRE
jgi:hypothetical protein